MIVCVEVAVKPEPSVTVQVTVFAPDTKIDGEATTLTTLQLSAAVGAVNCELAYVQTPASALTFIADNVTIVGFSASKTVTVCVEVAVKPDPSVTVQVTVFAPDTKMDGEATTLTTLQLSAAVGAVNCELAYVQTPSSALTFIADNVAIVGFCVSKTVIVCVEVAVKPEPSVTVQVTVFAPDTKIEGDTTTLTTLQLSAAVGAVNCELA